MRSLPPKSDTNPPDEPHGPTDLQSLLSSGLDEQPHRKPPEVTDFHTLKRQMGAGPRKPVKRTATDYVIDGLTPFMIFLMIYSVLRFLVDVRYIHLELAVGDQYAQMYEGTLRSTVFFFVMGAVALNRLIARDGKEESAVYIFALVAVVGLYTILTTDLTGSPVASLMNNMWFATAFNMSMVGFIWWIINRLTHECCVDSNTTAGEIGFLTGTARRVQKALGQSESEYAERWKKPKTDDFVPMMELNAVDPADWEKAETKAKTDYVKSDAQRAPKRHPGISVFYLSVLVMLIFAVGQRVILNGNASAMQRAHINLAIYTASSLCVLMLSSLAGLRGYFQERNVKIPKGIGVFWAGLGLSMTAFVMLVAMKMPMPDLPMRSMLPSELAALRQPEPLPDAESSSTPGHMQGGKKGKAGDPDSAREVDQSGAEGHEQGSDKGREGGDGKKGGQGSQGDRGNSGSASSASRASSPPPVTAQLSLPDPSGAMAVLSKVALVLLGIFVAIGLLRALAALAFAMAHRSRHTHQALTRLFGWLDRFIQRVTRLPSLPRLRRRRWVDHQVSLAARYSNPLRNHASMSPKEMVEYSYSALCALAEDLAVPRLKDQTPFEFIRTFPPILDTLRDEAVVLTNLYVVSAYSNIGLDDRNMDTLRRFWQSYEIVRSTVVR